jgi:hypothetical protein
LPFPQISSEVPAFSALFFRLFPRCVRESASRPLSGFRWIEWQGD